MTSPFKFNSIDFGPEQEGLVLHCSASPTTYFTLGAKYKVRWDENGAYLLSDYGFAIRQSSSEFMLPLPLTPKQPKVGEVWAYKKHKDMYSSAHSLYYVVKIEDGVVYHRTCARVVINFLYESTIQEFVEQNNFVF